MIDLILWVQISCSQVNLHFPMGIIIQESDEKHYYHIYVIVSSAVASKKEPCHRLWLPSSGIFRHDMIIGDVLNYGISNLGYYFTLRRERQPSRATFRHTYFICWQTMFVSCMNMFKMGKNMYPTVFSESCCVILLYISYISD